MKNWIPILFLFAFTAVACGGNASGTDAEQGPEYTSAYICPMHCEGSGSEEPGNCPVCGMAYVANDGEEDHSGHDHSHDHGDHEGHAH